MATSKRKQRFLKADTIVKCVWGDAWHHDSDHIGVMQHLPLTLVGHVIDHDRVGLKLAMERSPSTPKHRHVVFVPSTTILQLTVLEKP